MLAVTLGGSRAAGTARPDSDWDFAVYYRGTGFDPGSLRALGYARAAHAGCGHLSDTAGAIATAACQAAHAVLAARGQWVTNEKNLLERAGLRGTDSLLAGLTTGPGRLLAAVDAAETLLADAAQAGG